MDETYYSKEDQKNNQTEPNIKKKCNSIDKIGYKNRLNEKV